jgi:hypothetical protein
VHQGQWVQKSFAIPQPHFGHLAVDPSIFHFRRTFVRHHGQYRMNGISGPRQDGLAHDAVYRLSVKERSDRGPCAAPYSCGQYTQSSFIPLRQLRQRAG